MGKGTLYGFNFSQDCYVFTLNFFSSNISKYWGLTPQEGHRKVIQVMVDTPGRGEK